VSELNETDLNYNVVGICQTEIRYISDPTLRLISVWAELKQGELKQSVVNCDKAIDRWQTRLGACFASRDITLNS